MGSHEHETPAGFGDYEVGSPSVEEQASFEATIDSISELVGLYAAKVHEEEARPQPDREAIAAWAAERRYWSRLRTQLAPSDPDELQRARQRCLELVAQLRAD